MSQSKARIIYGLNNTYEITYIDIIPMRQIETQTCDMLDERHLKFEIIHI